MQKTPITYRFIGDKFAGKLYMARARAEMLTLERTITLRDAIADRSVNKSMIATRTVRPNTHTIIKCIKVAGMSIAEITIGRAGKAKVEKKKEKFLKMYVHVDMINTSPGTTPPSEAWHLEYYKHVIDNTLSYSNWTTYVCDQVNTDKFTREMVTSAVACGIVNQESGNLVRSDVKVPTRVPDAEDESDTSEEWLAVNDITPWNGLYVTDGNISNVNSTLEYYNELFPAAKTTLPVFIADNQWLTKYDLVETSIPGWTYFPSDDDIVGTYLYRLTETEWADPYIQYEGPWDYTEGKRYFYSMDNIRHNLYTPPVEGENVYSYNLNTRLVARYGHYVDDLGTTRWDEDYAPTGQWYTTYTNYHAILGHMWSGDVWAKSPHYLIEEQPYMSCQLWQDPAPYADWPWSKYWRNILELQPFKEHMNIYRDSDFPWYSPEDLPYVHQLTDGVDLAPDGAVTEEYRYKVPYNDITQNYILSNGFSCAIATYGGILANKDSLWTLECDPVYVHDEWHEDIVNRTVFNMAIKAGDAKIGKLSGAAVALATKAFEFLGGQVYDNASLPQLMSDERWSFINYYSKHSWPKYNDYIGLIYASPAYNIKVYVVPVGDK